MCIERSTPGSGSNISGSSLRSSPTAPINVRSVPREMWTSRPAARIFASTAAISASPASGSITMIIVRSFGFLQKNRAAFSGAARFIPALLLLTVARAPRIRSDKNRRTQKRRGIAWHQPTTNREPAPGRHPTIGRHRHTAGRSSRILPPFFDFALNRLGNIGPEKLSDVLIDRSDQVGARAIDDRLQALVQLIFETGVGEDVDALEHLHANVFGEGGPP